MTEFSKTFPVFYKWPDLTDVQVMFTGTCTKAVFSGTKSPPIEGRCALAHCPDTGTAHVYSHDCAGTSHRATRPIRM